MGNLQILEQEYKNELEEIKNRMALAGITVKDWAEKNEFSDVYVYKIMSGVIRGNYGLGFKIKNKLRADFLQGAKNEQ